MLENKVKNTGAQSSSEDGIEQFSFECGKVIGFALIRAVFNQVSKEIRYLLWFLSHYGLRLA